jgi:hypothetical protein
LRLLSKLSLIAGLLSLAVHAFAGSVPLALSAHGETYSFHHQNYSASFLPGGFGLQWLAPGTGSASMVLVNANIHAAPSPLEPLAAIHHLFSGNDSAKWDTKATLFSKIRFHAIYPGIDVVYYASPKGLFEYDFEIVPGARPRDIRLSFPGARNLRLDAAGNLIIGTSLQQHRPRAYQEVDGVRQSVRAGYKLLANNEVIFELGVYDQSRALVIDPSVAFATFLGGNDFDQVYAMALDGDGNIFLAGQTASANFPLRSGGAAGNRDIFVAKLGQ